MSNYETRIFRLRRPGSIGSAAAALDPAAETTGPELRLPRGPGWCQGSRPGSAPGREPSPSSEGPLIGVALTVRDFGLIARALTLCADCLESHDVVSAVGVRCRVLAAQIERDVARHV